MRRARLIWPVLALALLVPAGAAAKQPKLKAKAWALIDASSGELIASHAPAKQLAIASTTKMMTAHLALEDLSLKRKIAAPPYDAQAAESILGLRPGERLTVRDLLYALVLRSANDAAYALAKGDAGTEKRFVRKMNRSAKALGLIHTHYTTPVGLDERGNYSSAEDLVALARQLLDNRVFAKIADSTHAVLRSGDKRRKIVTRNTLLLDHGWVNGVKTGHTLHAGYVLVGSGRRRGVELISAVLGASSEDARDAESAKLLEYGFSLYTRKTVAPKGKELAKPGIRYSLGSLGLLTGGPLQVGLRRGQSFSTKVEAPREVSGPIRAGEQIGRLVALVDGHEESSVPLVAAKAVSAPSLPRKVVARAALPLLLLLAGGSVILVGLGRMPWPRRAKPSGAVAAEPKQADHQTREERRKMREERRQRHRNGPS